MKRSFQVILIISIIASLHSAEPIPTGKGSYASAPPDEKGVRELYSFVPELEE